MLGTHRHLVGNNLLCDTNKRLIWCYPCLHPSMYRRNTQHNPLYLIYPVRSNKYPHHILCTTFRLCRLGIDRLGRPNKYRWHCRNCLNHTHCTWPRLPSSLSRPIYMVGTASYQCHLLFLQTPVGNFGNHCRTSPHRTLGISHCHLRTANPLDNQCNYCFFLCH